MRPRIFRESHFDFALDLALNYGVAVVYRLLLWRCCLPREHRKHSHNFLQQSSSGAKECRLAQSHYFAGIQYRVCFKGRYPFTPPAGRYLYVIPSVGAYKFALLFRARDPRRCLNCEDGGLDVSLRPELRPRARPNVPSSLRSSR